MKLKDTDVLDVVDSPHAPLLAAHTIAAWAAIEGILPARVSVIRDTVDGLGMPALLGANAWIYYMTERLNRLHVVYSRGQR